MKRSDFEPCIGHRVVSLGMILTPRIPFSSHCLSPFRGTRKLSRKSKKLPKDDPSMGWHPAKGWLKYSYLLHAPWIGTNSDKWNPLSCKPIFPFSYLLNCRLLQRKKFLEVPWLNLLSAAWVQFMVHDWFDHGTPVTENKIKIPLQSNDSLYSRMKG